jgi:hypothetical protein
MFTQPLPNVGTDLVRIHKVVTRALEVSRQNSQADNLPEAHQAGFAAYVRALTILLDSHHLGEDELAFPFWKTHLPEDSPFDRLKQQHRQMTAYLGQINGWLRAPEDAWQPAARSKLHRTLTYLQRLWLKHIGLEEATIGPENASRYLTPEENGQLARQLAEHGQAHSQPNELVMPFVIYNLAGEDRAEFIKLMPPVMLQQLIPFAWKAVWAPMTPFLLAA